MKSITRIASLFIPQAACRAQARPAAFMRQSLAALLAAAALATCLGYLSWWCLERQVLKLKNWHPRLPLSARFPRSGVGPA